MEPGTTPTCTYVLPIRRVGVRPEEVAEFRGYFVGLGRAGCEVIVVDGSPPEVFAAHHRAWAGTCRHEPVDRSHGFINDKTNGVLTGVALASHEAILLADDDLRYTAADVRRMVALLGKHELVRPQNFLAPLPPWAALEAARMLINRAVLRAGDYSGTCGFRRSAFGRVGTYDGDVLFDNEEMVRHFSAAGADVFHARDFFILKRSPTLGKWWEQRPRQAYEDFGMRRKTALFAGLLPALALVGGLRGGKAARACALGAAGAAAQLAGLGRRGGGGPVRPSVGSAGGSALGSGAVSEHLLGTLLEVAAGRLSVRRPAPDPGHRAGLAGGGTPGWHRSPTARSVHGVARGARASRARGMGTAIGSGWRAGAITGRGFVRLWECPKGRMNKFPGPGPIVSRERPEQDHERPGQRRRGNHVRG